MPSGNRENAPLSPPTTRYVLRNCEEVEKSRPQDLSKSWNKVAEAGSETCSQASTKKSVVGAGFSVRFSCFSGLSMVGSHSRGSESEWLSS